MADGFEFPEWPRERLRRSGVEALTDAELLALVLGTGARGRSPVELGRSLIVRQGGLRGIAAASVVELGDLPGIGETRAAALLAAFALGRRAAGARLLLREQVGGSEDIFHHYQDRLAGLLQERFYVVLLDGKGRIHADVRVSEGTLTASLVHPREVFRRAIRDSAASIVLVHNHPSGDPTPSPEDENLTDRLVAAGRLLGIEVLDHVIIGSGCWSSFLDMGRISPAPNSYRAVSFSSQ